MNELIKILKKRRAEIEIEMNHRHDETCHPNVPTLTESQLANELAIAYYQVTRTTLRVPRLLDLYELLVRGQSCE